MDHFAPSSILCAVDFSEATQRVVDVATSIADRYSARMHLVHVWRLPTVGVVDGLATAPSASETERMIVGLREELARVAAAVGLPRASVETHLVEGDPALQILAVAKSAGCDLVVLGTHGRTGLPHLVMGSVAEHVVRGARMPVLVVPTRRS